MADTVDLVKLAKAISGPTIRRGKSAQDVETPNEFITALFRKFGYIRADLACTTANKKLPRGLCHDEGTDSLTVDWTAYLDGRPGYLNPPFDPVEPWVAKCAIEYQRGARILLLCRASIDANWWWDYVQLNAVVYALTPRIKFVGAEQGYPSPLVLCTFNVLGTPGGPIQRWRWR